MEPTVKKSPEAQSGSTPIEEVKKILAECDKLHTAGKFEESLQLASSTKAQSAPADILPYVFEMQVRNMYDLMMYQSAYKLLDQILKYMPLVKDFLFRKIQCEMAMAKLDEAKNGLENMKKTIEDELQKKRVNGEVISPQDEVWKIRVDTLLEHVISRKNRDLNKIRVYFKEATGDKLA